MKTVVVAVFLLVVVGSTVSARGSARTVDLGGDWRMKDLTRGVGVARQV